MAAIADGPAKSDGIQVGQIAATVILAVRANDGLSNVVLYQCSSNPPPAGEFEPDGGCGTQPVGVNIGQITPFTFRNPSRFRPDGPNPLTSNAYTEDFIETRDYGRFNSTFRTAEQTDIAYFWGAVDVHRGFIDLAVSHGLNVRDTARFFALVYTAAADANIAGFETKYFYRHWRTANGDPPSRRRRQSGHRSRPHVGSAAHGEPPGVPFGPLLFIYGLY